MSTLLEWTVHTCWSAAVSVVNLWRRGTAELAVGIDIAIWLQLPFVFLVILFLYDCIDFVLSGGFACAYVCTYIHVHHIQAAFLLSQFHGQLATCWFYAIAVFVLRAFLVGAWICHSMHFVSFSWSFWKLGGLKAFSVESESVISCSMHKCYHMLLIRE